MYKWYKFLRAKGYGPKYLLNVLGIIQDTGQQKANGLTA